MSDEACQRTSIPLNRRPAVLVSVCCHSIEVCAGATQRLPYGHHSLFSDDRPASYPIENASTLYREGRVFLGCPSGSRFSFCWHYPTLCGSPKVPRSWIEDLSVQRCFQGAEVAALIWLNWLEIRSRPPREASGEASEPGRNPAAHE